MKAVFIPTQYTGEVEFSKIELDKLPDRIGIVTTAQFQNKTKEIIDYLEKKGKNAFIFVFDTLDANEMENFPFIDFWISTACPRIADDKDKKNVIDMGELEW